MVRFLAIVYIIFLVSSVTTPGARASTIHSCAPLNPPALPGPLLRPAALHGQLFINEVLLNPNSTWNCAEVNTFSPTMDMWVELYNAQNEPFDLYAVHASLDSGPSTNSFYLPLGSAIKAHGFLVVFPRTTSTFVVSETPELRLLIDGAVVDEINLPALPRDQSYARVPDGSTTWQITNSPTIDASNTSLSVYATPTSVSPASEDNGSNSSSVYRSGSVTVDASGHLQQGDGVQPAWTALQLPSASAPSPTIIHQRSTSTVSAQTDNTADSLHKILLTAIAIALALTFLWCWKLFFFSS